MKLSTLDKITGVINDADFIITPIEKDLILIAFDELRKRLVAEEAGKEGVMPFICKGGVWHLTAAMIKEYEDTFIDMDILHEANEARMWCTANSSKRKTKSGMPRFLNSWLSRANDQGRYRKNGDAKPEGEPRNATKEDIMLAYGLNEEKAEKRMAE